MVFTTKRCSCEVKQTHIQWLYKSDKYQNTERREEYRGFRIQWL